MAAIDATPLESDPRKFLFVQDLGKFKPDWNALENNYGGPEDVIAALLGCPSEGVLTTLNEHIAYHPPLWTELFCKLVGGGQGCPGTGRGQRRGLRGRRCLADDALPLLDEHIAYQFCSCHVWHAPLYPCCKTVVQVAF